MRPFPLSELRRHLPDLRSFLREAGREFCATTTILVTENPVGGERNLECDRLYINTWFNTWSRSACGVWK